MAPPMFPLWSGFRKSGHNEAFNVPVMVEISPKRSRWRLQCSRYGQDFVKAVTMTPPMFPLWLRFRQNGHDGASNIPAMGENSHKRSRWSFQCSRYGREFAKAV